MGKFVGKASAAKKGNTYAAKAEREAAAAPNDAAASGRLPRGVEFVVKGSDVQQKPLAQDQVAFQVKMDRRKDHFCTLSVQLM